MKVNECDFATPTNTIGIGNPITPGENGELGSGDSFNIVKKKKKMRSLKDYLKKHRVG